MIPVILRLAEVHDAEMIYKLIDESRENLRQWLPWVDISKSKVSIENYLMENSASDFYNGRMIFEIFLNDEFCGMIDLHNGNIKTQSLEIGYWVGGKYQNNNIATEACRLLINKVFGEYDIQTIVIKCAGDNLKSQSIPRKLYFDLISTDSKTLLGEETHKMFIYELKKSMWERLKNLY